MTGDTITFAVVHVIQNGAVSTPRFWYRLTAPADELGFVNVRNVSRDMPLTAGQQTTLNTFITTKLADLKAIAAVGAAAVLLRFSVDSDGAGSWNVTAMYTLVGPSSEIVTHRRIVTLTAGQRTTLNSFMVTKLADLAALEA